jgi:uncharacterized lipoprotein YbaY
VVLRGERYALDVSVKVDVLVDEAAGERPPRGTPLHVELRDTSLADAPAVVLAHADTVVAEDSGPRLASVELPEAEDRLPSGLTVWAHADLTGSGEVEKGDYITMQSHPVPSPEQQPARLGVTVRPVR